VRGVFIVNNYYSDEGMEYCYNALRTAFEKRGIALVKRSSRYFQRNMKISFSFAYCADFIIFWDKDIILLKALEKVGYKVFNNAYSIETTDDKLKTYIALSEMDKIETRIPETIAAPLMYDINDVFDKNFLDDVERLGYPLIAKHNTGSQGRQVFKVSSRDELEKLYLEFRHIPHHYQKMMGEYGTDLRVYVVGGKVAVACIRKGTDFKSNLACGGQISLYDLPLGHKRKAEKIAKALKLDFGAIDFLISNHSNPLFLEANSNAYFKGIESLGVDIAGKIAEHIVSTINHDK